MTAKRRTHPVGGLTAPRSETRPPPIPCEELAVLPMALHSPPGGGARGAEHGAMSSSLPAPRMTGLPQRRRRRWPPLLEPSPPLPGQLPLPFDTGEPKSKTGGAA
jgi:hypothetical protein